AWVKMIVSSIVCRHNFTNKFLSNTVSLWWALNWQIFTIEDNIVIINGDFLNVLTDKYER
ncbi:hypothetical protein, partial [Xenorhabdus bovienii]|uniref:hypothetical protein n=1 Tax=Xenorhabdus bovienii TaxID=40576 RepID=UPI0023B2B4E6